MPRSGSSGARRVLGILALTTAIAGCEPNAGAGIEALVGATTIDVVSGRAIAHSVILVRDGYVVAAGPADEVEIPHGARRTDLAGHWVIPGLIDSHAHLQPWALPVELRFGVTAVRDLGGGIAATDSLRARVERSPAPHLFLGVATVGMPPGAQAPSIAIGDSSLADSAVAFLAEHGATWITADAHVTPATMEAVISAARPRHLPVAAQLGTTDASTAAQLGVESIEGLAGIREAVGDSMQSATGIANGPAEPGVSVEQGWAGLDTIGLATVARELAAHRVTLVPMLVVEASLTRVGFQAIGSSSDLVFIPDPVRRQWKTRDSSAHDRRTDADSMTFRAARAAQDFVVHALVAGGGRVVAGSDATSPWLVPGAALHTELALLVHAGLTPLDALRAATEWPAEMLRADSLGRLRPGTVADLVVLDADPLADIHNTRRISRVMLRGRWLLRQ